MGLLDTYRNKFQRKSQELAKLQQDKAKENKKLTDNTVKIKNASQYISRTKSASSIKSKLQEIARLEKDSTNLSSKIAGFETKISKVQKDMADIQKKIDSEESKEFKRRQQKSERQL